MLFFCWITKSTDRDTEYAVGFAHPRQKWLGERASTLHLYVGYITSLVKTVCGKRQVYILQNSSLQVSVLYINVRRLT